MHLLACAMSIFLTNWQLNGRPDALSNPLPPPLMYSNKKEIEIIRINFQSATNNSNIDGIDNVNLVLNRILKRK